MRWLHVAVLAIAATACPERKSATADSNVPKRPATETVEGHGGIAIDDPAGRPKPVSLVVPAVSTTPSEPKAGDVDASDFMIGASADAGAEGARERTIDLYETGYMIRDRNPTEAIRLFREVVKLTPADDEVHQKAQRQLDALSE